MKTILRLFMRKRTQRESMRERIEAINARVTVKLDDKLRARARRG